MKSSIEELAEAQEQPFVNAVFSGGGAKGAIYSGAHEVLTETGIIAGLEAVAGSSAGAITAAAIATGMTPDKFKDLSQNTDLPALLGQGEGVMVKTNKTGKPLLAMVRNGVRDNIASYLQDKDIIGMCNERLTDIVREKTRIERIGLEKGTAEESLEYEKLLEQEQTLQKVVKNKGAEIEAIKVKSLDIPQPLSEETGGIITFQDVALLRVLDPETFKDLLITATNKETGELKIFNAKDTPDVEVALACRASAAIPYVVSPAVIEGKEYVDGGYRDNIPLEYFEKKDARTLALAFGSGMEDPANKAIYSNKTGIADVGLAEKHLMNVTIKEKAGVGGDFVYTDEENRTYERLRKNALNTIVLDTRNVGTLDFKKAKEKSEYLHVKGGMQTQRYLANHDIRPITDPNFESKEFLLKVYEDSQIKNSLMNIFLNKAEEKKRLDTMLKFCKSGKDDLWVGKNKTEMLADFIETCSHSKKGVKALANALNDQSTPDVVKRSFTEVFADAGVSIKNPKKFKKKDFTNLLKTEVFKALVKAKEAAMVVAPPQAAQIPVMEQKAQAIDSNSQITNSLKQQALAIRGKVSSQNVGAIPRPLTTPRTPITPRHVQSAGRGR